jgi:hypothetical protein
MPHLAAPEGHEKRLAQQRANERRSDTIRMPKVRIYQIERKCALQSKERPEQPPSQTEGVDGPA